MKTTQCGFTLVELLITMLIGLFILSAVTTMLVSSNQTSVDTLRMIRMQQELRAVMNLMTSDLRRAGFNGGSASLIGTGSASPFSISEPTTASPTGTCILYSYDQSGNSAASPTNYDGTVNGTENYGFRLDSGDGAVERRQAGAGCSAGGWQNLTDENVVKVTGLQFTRSDSVVCNGTTQGAIVVWLSITLTGELVNDATVSRTLTERVRTRSEQYQSYPAGDCVNT